MLINLFLLKNKNWFSMDVCFYTLGTFLLFFDIFLNTFYEWMGLRRCDIYFLWKELIILVYFWKILDFSQYNYRVKVSKYYHNCHINIFFLNTHLESSFKIYLGLNSNGKFKIMFSIENKKIVKQILRIFIDFLKFKYFIIKLLAVQGV